MKIEEKQHNVVSNIDVGQAVKAKLGKSSIIADLLRKHYSNIKKTMVQEYISNARDAHRESNIPFNEIHISLPNKRSPFLEIRDFGHTMTEERLFSNFINYGESTKKDSDIETGGFGIGSKIAYAYTHTFYLILFKDGFEYLFQASTVNEPLGELTLVYKKESSQARGFCVKIPIAPEDFQQIQDDFYKITYYWEEPIKIVNLIDDEISSAWKNKQFFKTENFIFDLAEEFFGSKNYILIDSIPYFCPRVSNQCSNIGVPRFKTGEIKVAINREQIVSDDETINVLNEKAIKNYLGEEQEFKNYLIEQYNKLSFEDKLKKESVFIYYFKLHVDVLNNTIIPVTSRTNHTVVTHNTGITNKFKLLFDFSGFTYDLFVHEQNKTNSNYRLKEWVATLSSLKLKEFSIFIKDKKTTSKDVLKYKKYPKQHFQFMLIEENENLKNFKSFIQIRNFSDFISEQNSLYEKAEQEFKAKQILLEQKRKELAEAEEKKKIELELKLKKEEEERIARELSIESFPQYTMKKNGVLQQLAFNRKTKGVYITKTQLTNLKDEEYCIVFMELMKNPEFFIINDLSVSVVSQNPEYTHYSTMISEKRQEYDSLIDNMVLVHVAKNFSYKGKTFYERTGDIPKFLKQYIPNLDVIESNLYSLNDFSSMLTSKISQINGFFEQKLDENELFIEMHSKKFWDSTKESIIEFFFAKQLELYLKERYCYIEQNIL